MATPDDKLELSDILEEKKEYDEDDDDESTIVASPGSSSASTTKANSPNPIENPDTTVEVKHPLENKWTMWYFEPDDSKTWEESQHKIKTIDTVEEFWSLFNHIKSPSQLKPGTDYALFKGDIRPMWEDPANNRGGRWMIILHKNSKLVDSIWLDVLLCLIGEVFDNGDQVCGAVVNLRGRANKISIWTADGNEKDAIMEIGSKVRNILHMGNHTMQYFLHEGAQNKHNLSLRAAYTM